MDLCFLFIFLSVRFGLWFSGAVALQALFGDGGTVVASPVVSFFALAGSIAGEEGVKTVLL